MNFCHTVYEEKMIKDCVPNFKMATWWPYWISHRNDLNNFDRGPPKDHSYQISQTSALRFLRRRLSKIAYSISRWLTDGHVGYRTGTISTHFKRGPPKDNSYQVSGTSLNILCDLSTYKKTILDLITL